METPTFIKNTKEISLYFCSTRGIFSMLLVCCESSSPWGKPPNFKKLNRISTILVSGESGRLVTTTHHHPLTFFSRDENVQRPTPCGSFSGCIQCRAKGKYTYKTYCTQQLFHSNHVRQAKTRRRHRGDKKERPSDVDQGSWAVLDHSPAEQEARSWKRKFLSTNDLAT